MTVGERIADALRAACHPRAPLATSVRAVGSSLPLVPVFAAGTGRLAAAAATAAVPDPALLATRQAVDVDALVVELFNQEASSLVRLARLFVDDRNAAEDLVQEGFIRLARSAHRIQDPAKAAAYLRTIVLNLARDHNRRGLVSLRHHLPLDDRRASAEDEVELREDQQQVIDALRGLPHRQRDCLVLRYYHELGIDEIAEALGVSRNSVKTHLRRGLDSLERGLGAARDESGDGEAVL
jgi:RNA polymerase sigma-70 factor (sigma-E family)